MFFNRILRSPPIPTLLFTGLKTVKVATRRIDIGVRAIVLDPEGRVVLIRHTYLPGWHLPGGGIKRWETVEQAAIREVREEAGFHVERFDRFVGLYANFQVGWCNHVALFAGSGVPVAKAEPSLEVAEVTTVDLDALPQNLARGTAPRIRDWREHRHPSANWEDE